MAWIREWGWKLAILALPWQTRWFQEGPMAGGLPWEQGRLSVYVAWIPMILTIFVACADFKENPEDRDEISITDWMLFAGILLLGLPAFVSVFPQASWQWLTQVILLVFFAWSLQQLKIKSRDILGWSVCSLVPHALLGMFQFFTQSVFGSKWLGMAAQHPATPGVSVVEAGGQRILRAYGGFPHPNIFGGWLAYGLSAVTLIAIQAKQREKYILASAAIIFSVALVFTFSRSAWLAAALGVLTAALMAWRETKRYFVPGVILLSTLVTLFFVRDIALIRADTGTRLEQKSVSERSASLSAAQSLIPEEWWLGQGQNTAIFALDRAGKGIVPPHFIPILILLETGIIGVLGAVLLFGRWAAKSGWSSLLPLAIAIPLLLFDHYLWSIWSGQVLLMWLALLPLTKREK
ncbi:O-antigen ligase family protein [Patescibacteria group bacterium]|nr:O-antigen ligase family protein [Patescibacteria group bacterium]